MPHNFQNGFGGSISFNSVTCDVTEWSLSVSAEALDTTNTGDAGWETNILGAKSFEGSCKSFFDAATISTLTVGTRGTGTFLVGATGQSYSGTVQLTKISAGNPVKGVISLDLDFKGSGVLTMAT